jgi:hypothetical protein
VAKRSKHSLRELLAMVESYAMLEAQYLSELETLTGEMRSDTEIHLASIRVSLKAFRRELAERGVTTSVSAGTFSS